MVHSSQRKKRSSTKLFKTSSPLHRQRRHLQLLHSFKRTAKDLYRVDRLRLKRSQARTLRRAQLHSHRVLPVKRLNRACPARSLQWGNSLPAVLIPFTKDRLPNRHWRMRSRRPCLVHKLSGMVRQMLRIILDHPHSKVSHPDQPRTRSHKLRNSKGCNLRQDSNRLHMPAPISLLRLPRRKCKHRDRRSLRRRNLHLLHQHQQLRLRLRLLAPQDLLLLP
jgi:hypothetical protein